jgi:hypothetical protein
VQVTEEKENTQNPAPAQGQAHTAAEDITVQNQEEGSTPAPSTGRFQIRPEHFARTIDEQRERYTLQEEAEEARKRQEAGRQRLLEIAADYNAGEKPPLRGFRLWLARLFGLV